MPQRIFAFPFHLNFPHQTFTFYWLSRVTRTVLMLSFGWWSFTQEGEKKGWKETEISLKTQFIVTPTRHQQVTLKFNLLFFNKSHEIKVVWAFTINLLLRCSCFHILSLQFLCKWNFMNFSRMTHFAVCRKTARKSGGWRHVWHKSLNVMKNTTTPSASHMQIACHFYKCVYKYYDVHWEETCKK